MIGSLKNVFFQNLKREKGLVPAKTAAGVRQSSGALPVALYERRQAEIETRAHSRMKAIRPSVW